MIADIYTNADEIPSYLFGQCMEIEERGRFMRRIDPTEVEESFWMCMECGTLAADPDEECAVCTDDDENDDDQE